MVKDLRLSRTTKKSNQLRFSINNTGTNNADSRRNVSLDADIGFEYVLRRRPTNNATSTRTGACSTGETDAVVYLKPGAVSVDYVRTSSAKDEPDARTLALDSGWGLPR